MASVAQLQIQYMEYTKSLYLEGYLNDQFLCLQKLQKGDVSDPDFVVGLVSVYFEESEKLLNILTKAFQKKKIVDYKKVADDVHQFKGASSNIGAQRIIRVCHIFLNYCKEKNLDGCLWCLQQANHECTLIRNKLESLFKLEQKILKAGGALPIME